VPIAVPIPAPELAAAAPELPAPAAPLPPPPWAKALDERAMQVSETSTVVLIMEVSLC